MFTPRLMQGLEQKVTDKEVMQFKLECRDFLVAIVKKITDKGPLKFALARNLAFLDPREMGATAKEKKLDRCKAVLRQLNEADRVSDNDADEIIQQYIITLIRLLYHDVPSSKTSVYQHPDLMSYCLIQWRTTRQHINCVKQLLLLSHGQTSVERGFSVNKQIESDNLAEDTFVAKRIICDHVNSVGGLQNIDASDMHLLLAASSARQYLSDRDTTLFYFVTSVFFFYMVTG